MGSDYGETVDLYFVGAICKDGVMKFELTTSLNQYRQLAGTAASVFSAAKLDGYAANIGLPVESRVFEFDQNDVNAWFAEMNEKLDGLISDELLPILLVEGGQSVSCAADREIVIGTFPTGTSLERVKACASRAVIHSLRSQKVEPKTLGDFLVMEGIASVFSGLICFSKTPWLAPFDVGVQLDRDQLEVATSLLPTLLPSKDSETIAAALYGQTENSLEMPNLGGIEVAYWMLQNYFGRNPHKLGWALSRPSAEVVWESGFLT